jgi:hypothetical protein
MKKYLQKAINLVVLQTLIVYNKIVTQYIIRYT